MSFLKRSNRFWVHTASNSVGLLRRAKWTDSFPSNSQDKNEKICISTSPCAFVTLHGGNFMCGFSSLLPGSNGICDGQSGAGIGSVWALRFSPVLMFPPLLPFPISCVYPSLHMILEIEIVLK
jgi:hypothetical protein